jgi:myo-inositol catabolism protein IolC
MTQGWYGIAERVPKLMEKSDPMKIGIIIDGKFGDQAFKNIRRRCPTEWITSPVRGSNYYVRISG